MPLHQRSSIHHPTDLAGLTDAGLADAALTLARFAAHLEASGIERAPADALTAVVTAAREARASEVVIGVFVDPTEPAVARERAFAKLASRIVGRGGSGRRSDDDAAVVAAEPEVVRDHGTGRPGACRVDHQVDRHLRVDGGGVRRRWNQRTLDRQQ